MPPQPFDWRKLLDLVVELAKTADEPHLRAAISRSYYCAFHLARERLVINQFPLSRHGDSHTQIWEKFTRSPDSRCKLIGAGGDYLKERRIRADYEPYYGRIEEDAPLVLEKLKKFMENLDALPPELPRNQGALVR